MSDTEDGIFSCRNICWIVGGLLGLVAFLLILGSSVIWGLIVGIVLAVAIALVLQRLFCAATGAASVTSGGTASAAPAATPAESDAANARASNGLSRRTCGINSGHFVQSFASRALRIRFCFPASRV